MNDLSAIYNHLMELKSRSGSAETSIEDLKRQVGDVSRGQDELKALIVAMDQRMNKVSDDDHSEHHQFVTNLIRKHKARADLLNNVSKRLAEKGIVAALIFLVVLVWTGAVDRIESFIFNLIKPGS